MKLPRPRLARTPLDPPAAELRRLHGEYLALARKTVEHALRIGELLCQVKRQLGHGAWLPWLAKTGINARSAQRFMTLWRRRREIKSDKLSNVADAWRVLASAERSAENREMRRHGMLERAAQCASATRDFELHHASCRDAIAVLRPDSVDWIITDPMYQDADLPVHEDLAELAAHCLKPGGSLMCMIGALRLPEILAMLGAKLQYHWVLFYVMDGPTSPVYARKVFNGTRMILWYTKGKYSGTDLLRDTIISDGIDPRFHKWGKSIDGFRQFMRKIVHPGNVVLDPFLGGGTTGEVALELGARFVGFDIDESAIAVSRVRLNEVAARLSPVAVAAE